MRSRKDTPKIIRTAIEKEWTHVFFVSNPVVSIIARMVIDAYGIDPSNVICVSIRRSDTSLVCNEPIKPFSRWYDRALVKFFCDSPQGRRIANQLEDKKQKFIVYASWMYPEIERVVSSQYCQGHVYLEEGQQSYYQSNPYTFLGSIKQQRRKKILEGNINYYFREDASAYIGLSAESFPKIPESERFVLENFDAVRQLYIPRLVGVKAIGLMPAPHRIPQEHLESALRLFLANMPEGGVIKLHPGFSIYTVLRDYIASILERVTHGTVTLCDDNIIVELEMLIEPKVFIGARTSVSRYAEAFGSKFEFVQFHGYISPKN